MKGFLDVTYLYTSRLTFAIVLTLTLVLIETAASQAAIHYGDTIYIRVWNHPELSKQVTVDSNGSVRVPLSGAVSVVGLDEKPAAENIKNALKPYVEYPAVSVEVIEQARTIFLSGGLNGQLKYEHGETLSAAVADALTAQSPATQNLNDAGQVVTKLDDKSASVRARIDLSRVGIRRDGSGQQTFDMNVLNIHGDPGPLMQPDDTLIFAYKPIVVHVVGDVAQPGPAYLSPDQSISEAISQVGGLLPTSASNHILLKRGDQVQSLALGSAPLVAPAQSGDVLTIPRAPRVNVVGTVVMPGLVTLRTDPSLLSAMYTAGGPTKWANLSKVQVVSSAGTTSYDVTKLTHGDMTQNPILQDGDTVLVPEGYKVDYSGFFGILGSVAAGLASHLAL